MLLCFLEGCNIVFDDPTALHEHFIKHGQQHLEELHLDNQKLEIHRRLPLEMECEVFKCLTLPTQLKFITGLGKGIYGMFGPKIRALKKTKRLYNPAGNNWDRSKTDRFVTISPDGVNVINRYRAWSNVYSEKEFPIAGEHLRKDHFPGIILYYYEIILTSSNGLWGLNIGLSDGSIHYGKYFGNNPNDYLYMRYLSCHRWEAKLEWANGDAIGCGFVLSSENKFSMFYTKNGVIILSKPNLISPSVNCVYPTVAVYNTSFESNFGDNPAKPFKYDIDKCPGLILE